MLLEARARVCVLITVCVLAGCHRVAHIHLTCGNMSTHRTFHFQRHYRRIKVPWEIHSGVSTWKKSPGTRSCPETIIFLLPSLVEQCRRCRGSPEGE